MRKCEVIFDVAARQSQLDQLEQAASAQDFWNDQNKAREIIRETNAVRAILNPYKDLLAGLHDAGEMIELLEMEEDAGQVQQALPGLSAQLDGLEKQLDALELKSLLSGPLDASNAYLTIHAGAGGTESCDWADMLYRMYRRYLEDHGYEAEIIDYQPGDEAGIKSISLQVTGPYAYGYLRAERGVHRLVRISPFDSNKRRHTSFASLDVVAQVAEDVEIEINEDDLRIDTYRAGGAGGQHVNKTDSAIRITHLPTGIVVQCQAERSQHSNRAKAYDMLRARLYEYQMDQKRKEMERFYGTKGEIAWGHQIRSYVLQPYTMVKDHRTDVEVGNVQAVLDGALDVFIEAYLKKTVGQ